MGRSDLATCGGVFFFFFFAFPCHDDAGWERWKGTPGLRRTVIARSDTDILFFHVQVLIMTTNPPPSPDNPIPEISSTMQVLLPYQPLFLH